MSKAPNRRPRFSFNRDHGVQVAQGLFHAHGYDAVTITDLTEAMGIFPPSLYAAYGSKLALFERALRTYALTDVLPIEELLASLDAPAEVLTQLFVAAARHYTRDPERRGCMVTEAMRADDDDAAAIAAAHAVRGSEAIHAYVAVHASPGDVERITDYVLVTLRGLSSYGCLGHPQAKLIECAKVAGRALEVEFSP